MWTPIDALVVISALAVVRGAWLRRWGTVRQVRVSLVAGVLLVVASLVQFGPRRDDDARRLVGPGTARRAVFGSTGP
jgi:hypothetical protein